MTETMQLESFQLSLCDIVDVDLENLHALSLSVRWPHRTKDWQMLRENGHGIVARDAIGRVFASAMWFPYAPDFATLGMVITSPRLQTHGAARWLMNHAMRQIGNRPLRLNATHAARRLYQSLGFKIEKTVYQRQGTVMPSVAPDLPRDAVLRDVTPADLPALVKLDHQAFGARRTALFTHLLSVSKGMALVRDGEIAAFSLSRQFGRGSLIGPVVAANDADAIAVIHPLIAAHVGQFLRIDTRQDAGAFADFLAQSGLPVFDTVTSMSLGGDWLDASPTQAQKTYALVTQALS